MQKTPCTCGCPIPPSLGAVVFVVPELSALMIKHILFTDLGKKPIGFFYRSGAGRLCELGIFVDLLYCSAMSSNRSSGIYLPIWLLHPQIPSSFEKIPPGPCPGSILRTTSCLWRAHRSSSFAWPNLCSHGSASCEYSSVEKDFHTRAFNTEFLRIPCGRFLRVIVARGHLERL